MALKLPPTHRVDAPITYIDKDDGAWDKERWEKELEEMREREEDTLTHPMERYFSGDSRYDLDANGKVGDKRQCPRQYLKDDEEPIIFHLKRLEWDRYNEALAAPNVLKRSLYACMHGVKRIEGPGVPSKLGKDMESLSHETMQWLHEADPILPHRLGSAVLRASEPLSRDEKKS